MKKGSRTKLNRIILIIAVFALMLILSGCRTRVSNNSEVLSVYTDESGYMTEDYQYRRDDLGIPVAKKPYINLNTADDTYDEDYEDEDFNYDRSQREDDEDIDEEEEDSKESPSTSTGTTTRPSSTSSTTTTRRPSTVTRRPSTTTTTTTVTVVFNANGGTIKSGSKNVKTISRSYKKGTKLSSLPTPTKTDSTFQGWYTSKSSGSKVSTKTIVNYSTTYYAHWKDSGSKEDSDKDKKKEYTVTLVFDDGTTADQTIKVTADGTYDLPTPKRQGYPFKGWTDSDGNVVKDGDKVKATSDHKLTATWGDYDEVDYWTEEDNNRSKEATKISYYIDNDLSTSSDKSGLIKKIFASAGSSKKEVKECDTVVIYIDDWDDAGTKSDVFERATQKYGDKTVILVHCDDTDLSDKQELLYRIIVLENQNPGIIDADSAARELGGSTDDVKIL